MIKVLFCVQWSTEKILRILRKRDIKVVYINPRKIDEEGLFSYGNADFLSGRSYKSLLTLSLVCITIRNGESPPIKLIPFKSKLVFFFIGTRREIRFIISVKSKRLMDYVMLCSVP